MASTNIQTFPGKVGVSNTNPIHTLDIGSNVYIDDTAQTKLRIIGNIHASGVTVDGTITAIDSENLSVKDPIILLASGSTGTSDTGIIMKRADGDSNVAVFYDEGVGLKIGHTLSTAQDIHISVDSSNSLSTSIYGPVTVAHSSAQALVVQGGAEIADDFKVGTSKLFVDVSESNVGIGTNAPLATLDVHGTANVGALTATSISGPLSGNAATATALETARTIGGVSFDGTANIDLPGVNTVGTQNTSGNAATATALETARTIGGVSFDGTANIDLPGVNTSGNQDTTGNATTATTATNQSGGTVSATTGTFSGNVGIGTTSPSQILHLLGQGTGSGPKIRFETLNNGNGDYTVDGTEIGGIQFAADDLTWATQHTSSEIVGIHRNPNYSGAQGDLVFKTSSSQGSNPTEKMRINHDGNVGIGVTNPQARFHVKPVNNTANSENTLLDFRGDFTGSNHGFLGIYATETHTNGIGPDLRFKGAVYNGTSSPTINQVMCLKPTGNVGIGTASPGYKLDVNGDIRYTTHLRSTSSTQRLWTSGSSVNWIQFHTSGTSTNHILDIQGNNGNCVVSSRSSTPLLLNPSNGGNVGIGTTNPGAKLDVNGVIKNQNPSWNLYMQGSPTPTTSGTLEFNNTKASGINCTLNTSGGLTSRVTITVAGRYFIGFQAFTEYTVSSGSAVNYRVVINGSEYVRNFHVQPITNYSAMGGLGCLADLSVNDYVEIYSAQDLHYNGNASFYGFMIG